MGRFYGAIGYARTIEKTPGVWQEEIFERQYRGDIIRHVTKWRDGENLNASLIPDHRLSILADSFVYQNCHVMRYVEWMGTKWKINSIEFQRPRVILTIGGVYNGQTPKTPSNIG